MSLVGLRDMSVIETPPKDRMAIQTVVASWDDKLISQRSSRNSSAAGRYYFVHNRVESIWNRREAANSSTQHFAHPVGHGQMSEVNWRG
jgi:transcription-repair coupling factor (superfamily II helicase)